MTALVLIDNGANIAAVYITGLKAHIIDTNTATAFTTGASTTAIGAVEPLSLQLILLTLPLLLVPKTTTACIVALRV